MRTVTARDLRNHFADISKWIQEGETVTITRRGTNFATLSPASSPKPKNTTWAQRLAKFPGVGKQLTLAETEAVWRELRD